MELTFIFITSLQNIVIKLEVRIFYLHFIKWYQSKGVYIQMQTTFL